MSNSEIKSAIAERALEKARKDLGDLCVKRRADLIAAITDKGYVVAADGGIRLKVCPVENPGVVLALTPKRGHGWIWIGSIGLIEGGDIDGAE